MKNTALIFSLMALIGFGCRRHLTHEETVAALNAAMQKFLSSQKKIDTSKVKFNILGVDYFEDTAFYDCRFKVRMTIKDHTDTTGLMGAKISKDFSDVKRRF
jgi:hypothetical protein